jgi:hypothetical protein
MLLLLFSRPAICGLSAKKSKTIMFKEIDRRYRAEGKYKQRIPQRDLVLLKCLQYSFFSIIIILLALYTLMLAHLPADAGEIMIAIFAGIIVSGLAGSIYLLLKEFLLSKVPDMYKKGLPAGKPGKRHMKH